MKVRTLKNQNLNAHYEENGVPTKEPYQIKQNLASTIEANKKLNDEVIALRKEMSRNRNQIKSQRRFKVLEGNLKSIIARYSTMNEKLTLLQEELESSLILQQKECTLNDWIFVFFAKFAHATLKSQKKVYKNTDVLAYYL